MTTLENIQNNDIVKYRIGRAGESSTIWSEWTVGPVYVARRIIKLNKNPFRKSYEKNAIITITVNGTADFSIDHLGEDLNEIVFCNEDYYLQLDIPRK
jgi:hypothetical protein